MLESNNDALDGFMHAMNTPSWFADNNENVAMNIVASGNGCAIKLPFGETQIFANKFDANESVK